MGTALLKQNFQDWLTQQWVILFGEKINTKQGEWLLGPFGETNGIGEKFIKQLVEKEHLVIDKSEKNKGLLQSISQLHFTEKELKRLSKEVIDFYENTSNYNFDLKVKWNPFFRVFGVLLKVLFSKRIEQLNIPLDTNENSKALKSEIIQLIDEKTNKIKRTIWLRTFIDSKQVVYSGVYESCEIPSGQTCLKAIFPLPNGNATVILNPSVGENGELILTSSGKKIGDSGFYFLLKDTKGNLWTKFIRSFKDELVVSSKDERITAKQTLLLWNLKVLEFNYIIKKNTHSITYKQ
ncbi:hypothetical protein [Aequorivita antarctica]|uniref:Uncharacterized protein n=1 Tax=Aequorivita antarctica TaxID=153266 RepID=A0A5C6YYA5_9FLAO|nr:hypothetical protein [Aequorivita antarctica]TXD72241.1 hypothetical protein ESU54_12490 [Aequorivita antarctica]SRX74371.1 hypothetical protein AEQU3_01349 [Aequorivita antarctica]